MSSEINDKEHSLNGSTSTQSSIVFGYKKDELIPVHSDSSSGDKDLLGFAKMQKSTLSPTHPLTINSSQLAGAGDRKILKVLKSLPLQQVEDTKHSFRIVSPVQPKSVLFNLKTKSIEKAVPTESKRHVNSDSKVAKATKMAVQNVNIKDMLVLYKNRISILEEENAFLKTEKNCMNDKLNQEKIDRLTSVREIALVRSQFDKRNAYLLDEIEVYRKDINALTMELNYYKSKKYANHSTQTIPVDSDKGPQQRKTSATQTENFEEMCCETKESNTCTNTNIENSIENNSNIDHSYLQAKVAELKRNSVMVEAVPMVESNSGQECVNKATVDISNVKSKSPFSTNALDDQIIGNNVNMGNGPTISHPHSIKLRVADLEFKLWACFKMCDIVDGNGDYPIHLAVLNNNFQAVKRLTTVMKWKEMSIDVQNSEGQTPLHLALTNDTNEEIIEHLLKENASCDVVDEEGNNAFHLAVLHQEVSVMNLLPSKQCSIDKLNYEGKTPLILSVLNNDNPLVTALIKKGAEIDLRDLTSGKTALFYAVENNNVDITLNLLQSRADPNITNYSGMNCLDLPCELEMISVKIVAALKNAPANKQIASEHRKRKVIPHEFKFTRKFMRR